jgi:hypothetical protein
MKNLFSKLRIELVVLFSLALGYVIIRDLVLVNYGEIFKGGAELGIIVYNLCLSYASAFVFYFFVVYLKEQKDRNNLYGYIGQKTLMVIGSAKSLINSMAQATNTTLNGAFPTAQELTTLCTGINPNSSAPLVLGRVGNNANWIQYLVYFKLRSETAIARIFSKMQYLDSDFVKILSKIEDCSHFNTLPIIVGTMPIGNTNMTAFQSELSNYFELIKELEVYYNEKLTKYK